MYCTFLRVHEDLENVVYSWESDIKLHSASIFLMSLGRPYTECIIVYPVYDSLLIFPGWSFVCLTVVQITIRILVVYKTKSNILEQSLWNLRTKFKSHIILLVKSCWKKMSLSLLVTYQLHCMVVSHSIIYSCIMHLYNFT